MAPIIHKIEFDVLGITENAVPDIFTFDREDFYFSDENWHWSDSI